jgi:hypothetical protein
MRTCAFLAMAIGMTICVPASSEEIVIPKGPALGISIGQRAGDFSVGLDVTSPFFIFKNRSAIRVGGDFRLKEGVLVGGTKSLMEPYFAARIGYVRGIPVNNCIRMFSEIGGMAVFPTNDLASSKNPHYGAYGHFGGEFVLDKNSNPFNKSAGIYFEIGGEVNGSGKARFDKLNGIPIMGTGATACAGVRYYL